MSYANGRIYVDTSTDPDTGVSIYDVQQALSTSRQDLGELCTHKNINKWATFKPLPNGSPSRYFHDGTAPFGIRTIWRYVNPYTGNVSSGTNTTLYSAVTALESSILNNSSNPFLNDMAMYVPPTGGDSSAYRLADFVTAENVHSNTDVNRTSKNGYYRSAKLQYGYIDQGGNYRGLIGRSISVNSEGKIAADGNQNIDQSVSEIWGNGSFSDLDTRLKWSTNRNDEDNLCVLDWLALKWPSVVYNPSYHRAVVLFGDDWTEYPGFVAVGTIPWTGSIGQRLLGDKNAVWHCIEFLTNAQTTDSDFIDLRSWNNNYDWFVIPGLISKNLRVAGNDPYAIAANFQFADTNQGAPYGFNLYIQIRNMGANESLRIFLSTTPKPGSIRDFLWNRENEAYTVTSTGSYNIYGTGGPTVYPSSMGSEQSFNHIFTVGQYYYVCIWGKKNANDSSQQVIWSQAVVATVDDMLQIANI